MIYKKVRTFAKSYKCRLCHWARLGPAYNSLFGGRYIRLYTYTQNCIMYNVYKILTSGDAYFSAGISSGNLRVLFNVSACIYRNTQVFLLVTPTVTLNISACVSIGNLHSLSQPIFYMVTYTYCSVH